MIGNRTSRERYTLPIDVNPPTRVCFQVEVPNDIYHIAAFMGQIFALARWWSWELDNAHTAKQVAAVWMDVFDNLKRCQPTVASGGADEGVEQLIRQNPDNPCLLETSINGTDWCPFADLSKCVPASGQPGSGSGQPPAGGGQACYNAVLQGSGKWLLPTQVSTGDVIVISNVSGAATDGSGIWYCPNGQTFFLNTCSGAQTTSSGDPLNTSPHMSLIAKINGVYYPMYNASLTVPSGVSLANVEFQLNDSSLSDNFGEITFKACVTNNAAAVWTETFDFVVASGAWSGTPLDTLPDAVWVGGSGWVAQCGLADSGANYYQMANIRITALHNTTLTSVTVTADRTANGAGINSLSDAIQITGVNLFLRTSSFPTGTGLTMSWAGSQAWNAGQLMQINWAQDFQHIAGHSCPLVTPACKVVKVVVTGTGVNPFV